METPLPIPLPENQNEKRYVVRWDVHRHQGVMLDDGKFVVYVYDKIQGHIVFRAISRDRSKEYKWIKDFYGQAECDPDPGKMPTTPTDIRRFE